MCGICGIFGAGKERSILEKMMAIQHHRGPDATGSYFSPRGSALLGHNRLSIIDLSDAGSQPMWDANGRFVIVFNGEIYNYLELKAELAWYPFRSRSDTEVILAAFERWGEACLDHFIGMFSFIIWDEREQLLFAVRDRFGVKPLYYTLKNGVLYIASEIKAIRAAGFPSQPDAHTWATYLTTGLHDHSPFTFWEGIQALPGGHCLTWQDGRMDIRCWYDLAERIEPGGDLRPLEEVEEEYLALLEDSVRLRFRSDVPVGINLSGGLDSSTLLYLVQQIQGAQSEVAAFTFVTGDPNYDETPWVEKMIANTDHPLVLCELRPEDVPSLARSVQQFQDEPFGGFPTLAYARLFETARSKGVIVLLDGQGMDEQWAGYSYYRGVLDGTTPIVQGVNESFVRPSCLNPEFARLARSFQPAQPFQDNLSNLQYRDLRYTKIPRALRFNDRVSMRASTELREPFLDHRLVELALRQPPERKINATTGKLFLRETIKPRLPPGVTEAPKRALQTPQREWLRGLLRTWADEMIEAGLQNQSQGWLIQEKVRAEQDRFYAGESDNSFYIWQWINLGLCQEINILKPSPESEEFSPIP